MGLGITNDRSLVPTVPGPQSLSVKPPALVSALEDALRQLDVRVRRERGAFRGGRCTVAGRDVVVLNKLHPPEAQALVLADALRELPHDTLYLRPAVRTALDDAWDELDVLASRPAGAGAGPDTADGGDE